jgi:hypothetical protein
VRQTTMTVGIIGFEPKKLAYECDFSEQGKGARGLLGSRAAPIAPRRSHHSSDISTRARFLPVTRGASSRATQR